MVVMTLIGGKVDGGSDGRHQALIDIIPVTSRRQLRRRLRRNPDAVRASAETSMAGKDTGDLGLQHLIERTQYGIELPSA